MTPKRYETCAHCGGPNGTYGDMCWTCDGDPPPPEEPPEEPPKQGGATVLYMTQRAVCFQAMPSLIEMLLIAEQNGEPLMCGDCNELWGKVRQARLEDGTLRFSAHHYCTATIKIKMRVGGTPKFDKAITNATTEDTDERPDKTQPNPNAGRADGT